MDSPTESSASQSEVEEDLPPILRLSGGLLKEIALSLESSPTYTQDLLSLTLSCSQMGVAAVSALWFDPTRHIYRGKHDKASNKRNWNRFETVVERLARYPSLGQHVRELYFLGEITFWKAHSLQFWLPAHDATIVSLLDACPAIDTVAVSPWSTRQGGRNPFVWLHHLRKREDIHQLVIKRIHPGATFCISTFPLAFPPLTAVALHDFVWPAARLLQIHLPSLTTVRVSLESCDIPNLESWRDVGFDCPNLQHLSLHIARLPSALPTGLLPASLRCLVLQPSSLDATSAKVKREAFEEWARNSTNLVLSLPNLPKLVNLHIEQAWLSIKAFTAFAPGAPKLEELSLPHAEWYDDDVWAGDGDEAFLELVSAFPLLQRVNLGDVPLRQKERSLSLTEEYCHLNRIDLDFEVWWNEAAAVWLLTFVEQVTFTGTPSEHEECCQEV